MELSHDYYKVSLDDIWANESYLFKQGKRDIEVMQNTVDLFQFRITQHCDPFIQISRGEKKKYSDYETRKLLEWENALGDLSKEVELDFFVRGFEMYEYNHPVEFQKEDSEYLHFFILKLSQYEKKIGKVKSFLDYQRCLNDFTSNEAFYEYFSFALLEYEGLISKKLDKAILMWKESETVKIKTDVITLPKKTKKYSDSPTENTPLVENSPFLIPLINKQPLTKKLQDVLDVPKNKAEQERLAKFNSFCFYVENTDEFVSEKKVNDTLFLIYTALIGHDLISRRENDFESFTMIFRNLPIPLDARVMWLGNRKELQSFIKVLREDLKVLKPDYMLHYYIALKCFKNKDGVSYLHEHIADARDKKDSRTELKKIFYPLKVLLDNSPQKLNSPQV